MLFILAVQWLAASTRRWKAAGMVSCKDKFNLRRKARFNKGARAIIHSNRLLPVLSDGWIEIPCYLFRMFRRMSLYYSGDCRAHGEEDFIREDRH
jgi:hypothetical protein